MRGLFAAVVALGIGGCTLTTSLDGLSGGVPPSNASSVTNGRAGVTGGSGGTPSGGVGAGGTSTGGPATASETLDYRALVISDAPVAYYRLNDEGGTAKDEMGQHDGTYQGSVSHGPGAIAGDPDGALVGSGDGWVDVPGGFPFTGNAPYSIEAWVAAKPASTLTGVLARNLAAPGQSPADGYSLYIETDLSPIMGRWKSSAEQSASAHALTQDRFTHVVGSYDGTTLTVYIDGVEAGHHGASATIVAPTTDMTIGATRNGTYGHFVGALDEVALYDKALSAERVAAHFAAGTAH
jgi:hypothetical protein